MKKIEKLELKHLCGYLPHGLKIAVDEYSGQLLLDTVLGITNDEIIGENDSYQFDVKPLLLPLSALTEPMEYGTVPIVELAKMAFLNTFTTAPFFKDFETFNSKIGDEFGFVGYTEDDRISLTVNNTFCNQSFEFWISGHRHNCKQLEMFEYLYSKHFDIYGLIPAGLAIDKRTVKL